MIYILASFFKRLVEQFSRRAEIRSFRSINYEAIPAPLYNTLKRLTIRAFVFMSMISCGSLSCIQRNQMDQFVDVEKPYVFGDSYFRHALNFSDKEILFALYSNLKIFNNTWLHVLLILS